MNKIVKSYVDSIIALMPEVEEWQLKGIENVLADLYCMAYQEGEMRGSLNTLKRDYSLDRDDD